MGTLEQVVLIDLSGCAWNGSGENPKIVSCLIPNPGQLYPCGQDDAAMHAVTMRNKPKRTTITLPLLKPDWSAKGSKSHRGLLRDARGSTFEATQDSWRSEASGCGGVTAIRCNSQNRDMRCSWRRFASEQFPVPCHLIALAFPESWRFWSFNQVGCWTVIMPTGSQQRNQRSWCSGWNWGSLEGKVFRAKCG